jgi:2'-5' RNA ligase
MKFCQQEFWLKENAKPHITLWMFRLEKNRVPDVKARLSQEVLPVRLHQFKLYRGETLWWVPGDDDAMTQAHHEASNLAARFETSSEVHTDFFHKLGNSGQTYFQHFSQMTGSNFAPHVTLGKALQLPEPLEFSALWRWQLCVLGSRLTCAEYL